MEILFLIGILIFSVVIHEVSHGVVANALGDPTAKQAGRLTLNPIPHIDPIGSIALPFMLALFSRIAGGGIIFGWAKPVPVNPDNLRNQKYGPSLVSIAGPAANLAVALVFGLTLRFLPIYQFSESLAFIFSAICYLNILLATFNLLPLPPLDGSHVLFSFLPRNLDSVRIFLLQYGFVILLFFILFFSDIFSPFIHGLYRLIVGSPLFL
ncbi:MAG: site-2 protease family protein [bacterium]|nr:site-2 protease family protein [bacterium]